MIHSSENIYFSRTPDLEVWKREVESIVKKIARDTALDFKQGNSTLSIYDSLPEVKEVEEGQRFLCWVGEDLRQYVQIDGQFYYTTLVKEVE